MFSCPRCHKTLQPQRGAQGVVWLCPECRGHAASLGVLRKIFGPERVAVVWADATSGRPEPGCACPVCQGATARVNWIEDDSVIVLDLCQRCEFVWFDPNEYESIAPAPPRPRVLGDLDPKAMPEAAREALAMEKIRELARMETTQSPTPDRDWKTIPALFGFPVELDSEPDPRPPVATYGLTGLIAVVSLWGFLAAFTQHQDVARQLGLIPAQWGRDFGLTLVTSFFLHAGLMHLVGNLYFLVIFGRNVEEFLGPWRWLVVIAASALMGDVVDVALTAHSTQPLIGASGGISGILAFYALKFPHARLGMMFYFHWFSIPSWGAFALWVLLQTWGAYQQLHQVGNVASLAHLGGVIAGVAFWALWRNLDSKPAAAPVGPRITIS
jgi:membrane associated rhomboid family serine protease/Zn-finger nucleic acid-binding protein